MAVSKYHVNISYVPSTMNGQTLVSIGGVTQSVPTYSSEYYVASMPEVRISATGTGYVDALNNLLTVAASTDDPGNGPLSIIRTY